MSDQASKTVVNQTYSEASYNALLDEKYANWKQYFEAFSMVDSSVFASPYKHFRMRAEFRFWHEDDVGYHVMFEPGDRTKHYRVDTFTIGSSLINDLMQKINVAVNAQPLLKTRLFQVEYLTTQLGEAIVTLIYHRKLDDEWRSAALVLQAALGVVVIGRSKKQKIILDRDFVLEKLSIHDRTYFYKQYESAFTQPNAVIAEKMIEWVLSHIPKEANKDLLELYCGNGNFTLPLAQAFDKVLATEISTPSIRAAKANTLLNEIVNIDFVRMSAEELVEVMEGKLETRRLPIADLEKYTFSTIFVDPPRAGLDTFTEKFVTQFDRIIYISCQPETLVENLKHISITHEIKHLAMFDQFPYTNHVESGVILEKKVAL